MARAAAAYALDKRLLLNNRAYGHLPHLPLEMFYDSEMPSGHTLIKMENTGLVAAPMTRRDATLPNKCTLVLTTIPNRRQAFALILLPRDCAIPTTSMPSTEDRKTSQSQLQALVATCTWLVLGGAEIFVGQELELDKAATGQIPMAKHLAYRLLALDAYGLLNGIDKARA
ncbi:hypothetical protein CI102_13956 [Trichoderma harzianum]|nr:hypothetical protein CI102_13956 [Trichoderma harzianum]